MKYALLFLSIFLLSCGSDKHKNSEGLTNEPETQVQPLPYHPELVPAKHIVHRGIFSNDLKQYFITVSSPDFTGFNILVSEQAEGKWKTPLEAFFNSEYDDHGMSFSPDGKNVFFCSNRPIRGEKDGIWRLFKQGNNPNQSEASPINFPQMSAKHQLHPSLAPNGTLYFQASDLDYGNMAIYYAEADENSFLVAQKLEFDKLAGKDLCTPYVSADGQHLFFATVGEQLDLYVSKSTGPNQWSEPVKLPEVINQNSQGNPYLTPDNQYLFYTHAISESKWQINWVNTSTFLEHNTP